MRINAPLICAHALSAPLSRLTRLHLEGLADFSGEILQYATALEVLDINHCQGLDAANFAGLQRLRHLRLSECENWFGEASFTGLNALETVDLSFSSPALPPVRACAGCRACVGCTTRHST
jgi:hypothetical protein